MEIKFKALKEDVKMPTVNKQGLIELATCGFTQEFDKSGKMVLVYHTGLSVEANDKVMFQAFTLPSIEKVSLTMVNSSIIPCDGEEILAKFKITTDALPTIYQDKELVMQLLPTTIFGNTVSVEAYVAPEKEEGKEESKN